MNENDRIDPWSLEMEIEELFGVMRASYEIELTRNRANNHHGVRRKFLKQKQHFEDFEQFVGELNIIVQNSPF